MSRIAKAVKAAWAQLNGTETPQIDGKAVASSVWYSPTIGLDQSMSQAWGLRHQHEALVRMAVQWVGICAQFNAQNCASIPLRLYTRRGETLGMGTVMDNRMSVKSRTKNRYLRDAKRVGKSATYAEKAGDVDEVKEHPSLDLLAKPNPWWQGEEYRRLSFQFGEVCGNFYDLKAFGDDGRMLLPLYPQWTSLIVNDDEFFGGYWYGKIAAQRQRFDVDDVIHHKPWPAMDNPYYGVAPLHNIIAESNIMAAAVAYEQANLQNGMRPGDIAIKAGPGTTDTQVEQIRAELRRRYTGANQSGTPMILVDADAVPLVRTNKDMEYMQGMERIKVETLGAYGIPEALLMRGQGSISIGGGGEQSASMQVYQQLTVLPRIRAYAEKLTHELLPWFGIQPGEAWFAFDDPCGESTQFEVDKAAKLIPISVMTVNEARAEMDMPPVAWGDKPANQQVQSASPFGALPSWLADNRGNGDTGNPSWLSDKRGEQGGSNGSVTDLRKSIRFTDSLWSKRHQHGKSASDGGYETPVPESLEAKLYRGLMRVFKQSKPVLLDSLDASYGLRVRLDQIPELSAAFINATDPLSPIFVAGYEGGYAELPKGTYRPLNEPVIQAAATLRDYREKLLRSVSDTIDQKIRETIASGLELGASLTERTDAVAQILGAGMEHVAENVSRTESVNAYTTGSINAWQDSGAVAEVEWLLSGDPCAFCKAMAGRTTPLGVPFFRRGDSMTSEGKTMVFDYRDIDGPALHPNCRCGVRAVMKGKA